jgi:formylglycine-generating enzyme required for sulfatase activity
MRQAYLARRRNSAGVGSDFFSSFVILGLVIGGGGMDGINYWMSKYTFPSAVILGAVSIFSFSLSAQADTFGSGSNAFTLNFVQVSQTNNATDPRTTNKYGAVPYEYRASIYEISQNDITKATAGGLSNVTAGTYAGNRPAASISWYEAAAFVNWLNTSSGKTAAYALTFSNSQWSMALQSSSNAWTLGGTNLYRNKDAYYFLPSENEWYKAAYYNAAGTNYFLYPMTSSNVPSPVASGTNANTAVYLQGVSAVPADVNLAGGSSTYGTRGQAGNMWEWMETAADGTNTTTTENRNLRGGRFQSEAFEIASTRTLAFGPSTQDINVGFRVASIPEPSTYVLLLLGAGAMYLWKRRRDSL